MGGSHWTGLLIVVGIVFLVLRLSNNSESQKAGIKPESSGRLFWVAVIGVLAFIGLTVLTGDWNS